MKHCLTALWQWSSHPLCAWPITGVLLASSFTLLQYHVQIIRSTADVWLPLAASVANLEDRRALLEEQIDVAQAQDTLQSASLEEAVHAYVLPKDRGLHRIVATFDILQEYLKAQGVLRHAEPLDIRAPMNISLEEKTGEGETYDVSIIPIHLSMNVRARGTESILGFLDIAGMLTVFDALRPQERDLLIRRTEVENPAGIVAVEQFFATDLLQYAQNARSYEEQLLRSFTTPAFEAAFQSVLQSSLLSVAKDLLNGPFGRLILQHDLWPMRFMEAERMSIEVVSPDDVHVEAVIRAYARA